MKRNIIICSLILATILTGCGDEKGNNTNIDNNAKDVITSEKKEKKEDNTDYGFVTVDKVRLRETSSINSAIVAEMPIWSKLTILGKSQEKQAIGEYNDYWYNVQYEDKVGWCYGGLLINIDDISAQEIDSLKKSFDNCSTFKEAKNILKAISLATNEKNLIDIGVRRLLLLQSEYGKELNSNTLANIERMVFWRYSTDELNNPQAINEDKLRDYVVQIKEEGFRINVLEGSPCLVVNPKKVLYEFEDYISESYKEYLTLKSYEIEQPIGDEGFILITWDELADRIASWEKFITKYPDAEAAQDAVDEYFYPYLYIYTHGTHNTKVFDEENKLTEEVKDSFRYFINTYEDLKVSEKIKELYQLLKKNKYEKNDIIDTYLEELFH